MLGSLFILALVLEYRMQDVSYINKALEALFDSRSIGIAFDNGAEDFMFLDQLQEKSDPDFIKETFLQKRIIDYYYNSDNVTLDSFFLYNITKNPALKDYYLVSKNKFLGMTMKFTNFDNLFASDSSKNFYQSLYNTKAEIYSNLKEDESLVVYMQQKNCTYFEFTEKEKEEFMIYGESYNTLFFPAAIEKCKAENIAFLQNSFISDSISDIEINGYFKNPISKIIFNYQIIFERSFPFG